MDRTNYRDLNNKVTASLNKNIKQNNKSYIANDIDMDIDKPLVADADPIINKQVKQNNKSKPRNYKKPTDQPIMQVSNNKNKSKLNQRMRLSNNQLLESYNNQTESMMKSRKMSPQNFKEDYIVNYEEKNRYFQKRKDSLKKILNNTSDKKIVLDIKKQIEKDSLEQLRFYRNFDKIMLD